MGQNVTLTSEVKDELRQRPLLAACFIDPRQVDQLAVGSLAPLLTVLTNASSGSHADNHLSLLVVNCCVNVL